MGLKLGDRTEQAYLRDVQDLDMAAERAAAMQKYADYLESLKIRT